MMWYKLLTISRDDAGVICAKVSTDAGSPWFSGHFPGDPILPGIAQLYMVTECIEQGLQQKLILRNLARVKFKQLIRPGDILDIQAVVAKKENSYAFQIHNNKKEVCSGRLVLAPRKEQ